MVLKLLSGLVAALLLAPATAGADTFDVNSTADPLAGGGVCPGTSCTLRAALAAAQGTAVADTILVPAATYTLTSALSIASGTAGISIIGDGANSTVITQSATARVLSLQSSTSALSITGVTLRNGNGGSGSGGNVLAGSQATLTLTRVRLTGGTALQGGGIGIQGSTRVDILDSLIDGNTTTGTASSGLGGGIYLEGQTFSATLNVQDSTITGNSAQLGGAFAVTNNVGPPITFTGVTIARNTARGTSGGGLYTASSAIPRLQNSIVAANTATAAGVPVATPSNCTPASSPTNLGGNVETGADCGFAGHQNTDPLLATALDASSPPALAIPANSPAVDIAACPLLETSDQRGVARPQGIACDAGAFEYQAPPVPPAPTPTPTATPAPTATPPPVPAPTPTYRQTVVVRPVKGTVLVRSPGSTRFVALDATAGIALGSSVDVRKGTVELSSQRKPGAAPQKATFFDGLFKVTQTAKSTDLTLTEALAACPRGKAGAAAAKPRSRKLWGDGSGSFRTRGRYSAATVRGTKWLVQDTCAGTLTKVSRGSVLVRDNVLRRNAIVRAGHTYLAKPRG